MKVDKMAVSMVSLKDVMTVGLMVASTDPMKAGKKVDKMAAC